MRFERLPDVQVPVRYVLNILQLEQQTSPALNDYVQDIDILLMDGQQAGGQLVGVPVVVQAGDAVGEAVDGDVELGAGPALP